MSAMEGVDKRCDYRVGILGHRFEYRRVLKGLVLWLGSTSMDSIYVAKMLVYLHNEK